MGVIWGGCGEGLFGCFKEVQANFPPTQSYHSSVCVHHRVLWRDCESMGYWGRFHYVLILSQGCLLSPILFVIFMDKILGCSRCWESVRVRNLTTASLHLFSCPKPRNLSISGSCSCVRGKKVLRQREGAWCGAATPRVERSQLR